MRKIKIRRPEEPIRIFTDGSGRRPDGKGSGFAWFRPGNGQRMIVREDNLTNNQAEYKAIHSALECVSPQSKVEILTDSENTCFQLKGERRVRDSRLAELNAQIRVLIEKKHLNVTFTWIPRGDNLAGKLI
jgi:ribonuclease HI